MQLYYVADNVGAAGLADKAAWCNSAQVSGGSPVALLHIRNIVSLLLSTHILLVSYLRCWMLNLFRTSAWRALMSRLRNFAYFHIWHKISNWFYLILRPLKPIMGLAKCENLHIIFFLHFCIFSHILLHFCIFVYISHIFFHILHFFCAYFMVYTV